MRDSFVVGGSLPLAVEEYFANHPASKKKA